MATPFDERRHFRSVLKAVQKFSQRRYYPASSENPNPHVDDIDFKVFLEQLPPIFYLGLLDNIFSASSFILGSYEFKRTVERKLSELIRAEKSLAAPIQTIIEHVFEFKQNKILNAQISSELRDSNVGFGESNQSTRSASADREDSSVRTFSLMPEIDPKSIHSLQSNLRAAKDMLMLRAAESGDGDMIEKCLLIGSSVETTNINGETPLMLAAAAGHFDIVYTLLRNKSSTEQVSRTNATAIYYSVVKGHLGIVKLLIAAGADVLKKQGKHRKSLLSIAVENRQHHIAEVLKECGKYAVKDTEYVAKNKAFALKTFAHVGTANVLTNQYKERDADIKCVDGFIKERALHVVVQSSFFSFDDAVTAGEVPLLAAAKSGDYGDCAFVLKYDADANVRVSGGKTPLIHAACQGSVNIMRLLLNFGASVDAQDDEGRTALMYACKANCLEASMLLLHRGADINLASTNEQTALMVAAESGSLSIVKLLYSKSVDMDAADKFGFNALCYAAKGGQVSIFKFLLDHGANVCCSSRNGTTALMLAAASNSVAILEMLLSKNCDVNDSNADAETALWYAIEMKNIETCKFLIDHGADIDASSATGDTPLMLSIEYGSQHITDLLLESGASVMTTNRCGKTALGLSLERRHFDLFRSLVDRGADINRPCLFMQTPLMVAAMNNWTDIMSFLLNRGADVDTSTGLGYGALAAAGILERREAFDVLISCGASMDLNLIQFNEIFSVPSDGASDERHRIQNSNHNSSSKNPNLSSYTALMHASRKGWSEAVKEMLAKRADVRLEATDIRGKTALLYAAQNGHKEICIQLLEQGASVNVRDAEENTFVLLALENNLMDLVELAVTLGADVNASSSTADVPLLRAAQKKDAVICRIFIEHGAMRSLSQQHLHSFLAITAENGWLDLVELAIECGAEIDPHSSATYLSPLLQAAEKRHLEVCDLLIHKGADVKLKLKYRDSFISTAARNGWLHHVKLALNNGAHIDGRHQGNSFDTNTALFASAKHKHSEIFDFLLANGADVNKASPSLETPLMIAAQNGWVAAMKRLLDQGADINARNSSSKNVVSYAANEAFQFLHSEECKKYNLRTSN